MTITFIETFVSFLNLFLTSTVNKIDVLIIFCKVPAADMIQFIVYLCTTYHKGHVQGMFLQDVSHRMDQGNKNYDSSNQLPVKINTI